MKINKIFVFGLLIVLMLGYNIKNSKAYSCEYKSEQSIEEFNGTNSIYGCGSFELTIDDKTGEISSNVKFSNSKMQVNTFSISQGWKDFTKSNDFNGDCPYVYSGTQAATNNYCNIYMGWSDLLDPTNGDNKYTFDYGDRTDEPRDPDEDVPKVDSDHEKELYSVLSVPDGHQYVNAGECLKGNLRKVWINIGRGGIEVLGCVDTNQKVSAVCGSAVPAAVSQAKRIDKTDDKTKYYAQVCYNTQATPNAKTQYACYYENNVCGNFNIQRDSRGKLTVNGLAYQESVNNLSETAFKDSAECPDLYVWLNNNTCYISSRSRATYTKISGVLYNEYVSDKVWGSNNDKVLTLPNGDSSLVVNPNAVSGMDICSQNGIKQVLHILGILIFIVKLVVPLILIVMGTIDLVSALKDPDDKSMKDQLSKFVKRILIAIIIFLIPTIINFAFSLIDNANNFNTKFSGCTECLFRPFGGNCNYSKIGE